MKKSFLTLMFLFALCNILQAKEITYVEVVAGNPVTDEVVKNFNLVRAVDDEGFVQMIAVFNQTDQYWRSRLIKTDTSGSVLWSRDYLLYGDPGANHRIDGVPFSICRSATNDGYVIAGIFSESRTRVMEHGGYQSSFYLRVDAVGNVQNVERHTTYIADSLEIWCFAPLKIKAVGDIGYVVAGVMSDSLSDVTSGTRMGRLCLLDTGLNETKAVVMQSWHAANSNIASATGTFYDALNNVEVVEIPGEGYHYICSGSMTGEMLCPFDTSGVGDYGNALPFIGRFDDTLGYMWHRLGIDSVQLTANRGQPTVAGGLEYSPSTGTVFMSLMNPFEFDLATGAYGRFLELDAMSGSLIQSFDAWINSSTWSNLGEIYFYITQIELQGDTLLMAGYTHNDHHTTHGLPIDQELTPIVFLIDNQADTAFGFYLFPSTNSDYLSSHSSYLSYQYRLGNLPFLNRRCNSIGGMVTGALDTGNTVNPVIYSPDIALFNSNKNFGIDAIAGVKKDSSSLSVVYRPALLVLNDLPCVYLEDHLIIPDHDLISYDILLDRSFARRIEMDRIQEDNDHNILECP
jgi:hypothetical protein